LIVASERSLDLVALAATRTQTAARRRLRDRAEGSGHRRLCGTATRGARPRTHAACSSGGVGGFALALVGRPALERVRRPKQVLFADVLTSLGISTSRRCDRSCCGHERSRWVSASSSCARGSFRTPSFRRALALQVESSEPRCWSSFSAPA
jgi:hypothetical protein